MVGINTEGVRDSLRGRKGGGLPPPPDELLGAEAQR